MRHACLLFVLLVLNWFANLLVAETISAKSGEFPDEKITVGNVERSYRLVVPESVNLKQPAPLVFAFHGFLIDSKDFMPKYTRLNETAEKHEFLLVYPEAVGKSWGISAEKIAADLAFFDALLKKLSADYQIDERRIYTLGMSNGGYFSHLLGKERSETIAAVASHSGPLGLQTLLGIGAKRKFPVLIIHGDSDRLFPLWIAQDNRDKYKSEGHPVQYEELARTGHIWGARQKVNETIWEFFKEHPLGK